MSPASQGLFTSINMFGRTIGNSNKVTRVKRLRRLVSRLRRDKST
jgi:hypothetical protein